jgi:Fe-S oxidoreductase
LVGISRQRQLPEFATVPFTLWFKRRQGGGEAADGRMAKREENNRKYPKGTSSKIVNPKSKKVVLFNDTFNTYNYPLVSIAATELFEAAGFEVILPGHRCCGRPMISKGLLRKARRAARDTIERLTPFAEQGIPIVGLEPSCILSLRDDYFSLLPGDWRVKKVAEQSYTFEEFMAKLADEGELDLEFREEARQVLLHGHCHQKALVGSKPSQRTLTLPGGYTVTEVDSGCCGMAGSFGYEAEHYDMSLAMAERRLLPAVREQSADTLIAAAGVSCRQQIKHGAGKQAYHPAEILRTALIK